MYIYTHIYKPAIVNVLCDLPVGIFNTTSRLGVSEKGLNILSAPGNELCRGSAVLCQGHVWKPQLEDDRWNRPWEEARLGMKNFSEFTKEYGLESDVDRIIGKYSLQEVESGAVVPVGKLYVQKEPDHTPISCWVQTKHTIRPMIWGSSSTPVASYKYLTKIYNGLAPESLY